MKQSRFSDSQIIAILKQAEAGSWSKEKLQSRLSEAKQSCEFALEDKNIFFVLNDDIGRAVQRLQQILTGQPPADEQQARATAENNYPNLLKLSPLGGSSI